MKVEITLSDDKYTTQKQLQIISEKLCELIKHDEYKQSFGIPIYNSSITTNYKKTDGIETGERVKEGENVYYTVRKTKGGVYKVNVWGH